jgi:hypothetical protein
VLAALSGCGGADVKKISGTLTYKGKPVPSAIIEFQPEQGRMCSGETDEQGHFTMRYDNKTDGVVAGKNKVTVHFKSTAGAREPGMPPKLTPEMDAIVKKYGPGVSKKEVTIDKSDDDFKLDLD